MDEPVRVEPTRVYDIRQHGGHLFLAHAEEVEPGRVADVNPDWYAYAAAEKVGTLVVFGAWVGPAEARMLVGYIVATVYPEPHYAHRNICQVDLIFVDKPWRKRGVGWNLVNRMRAEARSRNAHRLLLHAKEGSAFERMLKKTGFEPVETIYAEEM